MDLSFYIWKIQQFGRKNSVDPNLLFIIFMGPGPVKHGVYVFCLCLPGPGSINMDPRLKWLSGVCWIAYYDQLLLKQFLWICPSSGSNKAPNSTSLKIGTG